MHLTKSAPVDKNPQENRTRELPQLDLKKKKRKFTKNLIVKH